ncbi:IS3 family transposase, partial [Dyella choica]
MATQHGHAVRTLCRTLHVSPSGYYAWRCRESGNRAQENLRLVQCIQELHAVTREAYGTTRIWKALRQEGEVCGRHRVRRLRQQHAIQTRRRRRYMRTRAPPINAYRPHQIDWRGRLPAQAGIGSGWRTSPM